MPEQYDPYDDYCYECGAYGDDYRLDESGEWVSACGDCPFNGNDDLDGYEVE